LKNINILSLVQAYSSLEKESYTNFLSYYGIEIRNEEVEDLKSLVNIVYNQTTDKSIFNKFYVSYKIPQIGKEFDLLRFGKGSVINVELKSTSTEKIIQKQLKRNKYYLSYIEKSIYNFSFVSDNEQLYFLNNSDGIDKVDISFLEQLLRDQELDNIKNIDDLFNPSDYLVSPFNSTNKFLKNKYFLTHQQEEVKSNVIKIFKGDTTANFISIRGSAGTGKTLLIYDIVKEIRASRKKPLIVHCGYLNSGQEELKINGWKIIPIKNINSYELSNYDAIFIDEAQRIYPDQLTEIVDKIKSINGNCIFSYDKLQTLANWEEKRDIDAKINNIDSIITYRLSEKIRTNKEISTFIKTLFNKKRNLKISKKDNIELNYFKSLEDAKAYLGSLNNLEWEVLRFTPSQYKKEHHEQYSEISSKNSHKVIGQEFENVVVVIDRFFSYNEIGALIYRGGTYYDPVKMLFQNITRTIKRLNLVIINNEELLDRCVSILQN
jgi:Cdc6-like AAA superfamily ATPase